MFTIFIFDGVTLLSNPDIHHNDDDDCQSADTSRTFIHN